MSLDYDNSFIKDNMLKGDFGLEMESLRVDKDGFLSKTKHPFNNIPNIDRDFCESQVEIITNVWNSVQSLYAEIGKLRNMVVDGLKTLDSGEEFLWSFSNPPYVKSEDDIHIASFTGNLKDKEIYRQYLAEKYGKRKMLFSGIHFNFSFPEDVLTEGYEKSNYNSYKEYKNQIYIELAKKLTQYSWLIVYLTAASPVMDGSFFKDDAVGKDVEPKFSSPRCSEIGYWNDFIPILSYDTLSSYVKSIQSYVDSGKLKSISELYYPIRLKPRGENSLENLEQSGINHIELRMLDVNPLSDVGIIKEDIEFIHLLIVYLMSLEDKTFEESEQISAIKNIKHASEFDDENIFIKTNTYENLPVKEVALETLQNMEKFFSKYGYKDVLEIIEYQKNKITDKEKRYAVIIKEKFGKNYVEKGIELAKKYANY